MRFKLSDQDKEKVLREYQEGKSLKTIAKEFGCSVKPISNAVKNSDVKMRGSSREVRKYTVDETYFDSIDTPNKAYVLGFMYADGCNNINRSRWLYQWSLRLKADDIQILKDIANDMRYTGTIREYSQPSSDKYGDRNCASLIVCSKHMCEALCACGVVPNKTFIISFPYWMDENLIPHFMRGVFDGDGCINNKSIASLVGNECFIKQVCETVGKTTGAKGNLYQCKQSPNIYQYVLSGKENSKLFLDWIYNDSDLKLQRKYDRYVVSYC